MSEPSATAEDLGEVWDLENLARATRLCDWMFDQFADLVGESAVEIGAGIGTFSERLLRRGARDLLLIEPEPACMAVLERRFADDERVELAQDVLPGSPALQSRREGFDFALCQNVLEHIADHDGAVAAIAASLKPGGRLGVLVPAHPALYGRLDRGYGHERRYTRDGLRGVLEGAGLTVEEMHSFNLLGVPGWWVKNRFGSAGVDARSLWMYERLLRVWRPLEEKMRPSFGLSLVAVARRPGRATSV